MDNELTVEEGIAIQNEQLQKWKQLLKEDVYNWLEKKVTKENHLAKNGYQIVRGCYISDYVENYLNYKERGEL